jgi:hypothetical protein
MASDMTNDDLTTIITWALDRILHGEFKEAHDASGEHRFAGHRQGFRSGKFTASAPRLKAMPQSRMMPFRRWRHRYTLERKYARDIRNLLPAMIGRAHSLCALPSTAKELPEYVNRYLSEAAQCYIYGHALAALFLCRSALGEAVVVALRKNGPAKGMAAIKEDGLRGILEDRPRRGLA